MKRRSPEVRGEAHRRWPKHRVLARFLARLPVQATVWNPALRQRRNGPYAEFLGPPDPGTTPRVLKRSYPGVRYRFRQFYLCWSRAMAGFGRSAATHAPSGPIWRSAG
jgi:hypothetical protein